MKRWILSLCALALLLSSCSDSMTLENLLIVTPEPMTTADAPILNGDDGDNSATTAAPEASAAPVLPVSCTTGMQTQTSNGLVAVVLDTEKETISGISHADVVYEFLPENANSTSIVALFHDLIPENISPLGALYGYQVPYLRSWMPDAVYVFGTDITQTEANRAVTRMQNWNLPLVDAAAALDPAFHSQGDVISVSPASFAPGKYDVQPLNINAQAAAFDNMAYTVRTDHWVYRFDEESALYSRYVDGVDAKDADGTLIEVTNLVFLRTDYIDSASDKHCDVNLQGGEADIFCRGSASYGHWAYDEATGQITLTDLQGNPVTLCAGKTWFHIIPEETGVDYE